jgi:hypothetical protein
LVRANHFTVLKVQKVSPASMEYKPAVPRIENHRPPAADDLRRTFEAAVCKIHQADLAAGKKPVYRTPIVPRRNILGLSPAGVEKRALMDAAHALALLWKV